MYLNICIAVCHCMQVTSCELAGNLAATGCGSGKLELYDFRASDPICIPTPNINSKVALQLDSTKLLCGGNGIQVYNIR